MGTMCVPSKALWPTLNGCKWGYLVFHRKRLESRALSWQQHGRCHSISFVMYIAGAKMKNTALIFLELFSIECCAVSVEPPKPSSLSSFA